MAINHTLRYETFERYVSERCVLDKRNPNPRAASARRLHALALRMQLAIEAANWARKALQTQYP
ncbi:MAG TPA: hypothetical protein VN306_09130 [Mycobacterium sp.]|nr:hypothetical protein [Mycobacterium sp.]